MPPEVLQRFTWHGQPRELGYLFVVHKGNKTARCQLMSHQLARECRLVVGQELVQSQVCRDQESVFTTGEAWRAEMLERRRS